MHKIKIEEDHYLLSSLTRACQLKNDHLQARLPIHKGMLAILVRNTEECFCNINQLFMACLFKTLLLTMYYGMFRISEVTTVAHPVLARDVHIGKNKKKFLFILKTSKTHTKGMPPQLVKITSLSRENKWEKDKGKFNSDMNEYRSLLCPCNSLRQYTHLCGGFHSELDPFFVFSDGSPVAPKQFTSFLKKTLTRTGFNNKFYGSHSLRSGRSGDLYKLGLSVETIKKMGCWKSNAVFRYLKSV